MAERDLRAAIRLVDRTVGQLSFSLMPKKLAKAWRFLVTETDIVVAAVNEVLGINRDVPSEESDDRLEGIDLPI